MTLVVEVQFDRSIADGGVLRDCSVPRTAYRIRLGDF